MERNILGDYKVMDIDPCDSKRVHDILLKMANSSNRKDDYCLKEGSNY